MKRLARTMSSGSDACGSSSGKASAKSAEAMMAAPPEARLTAPYQTPCRTCLEPRARAPASCRAVCVLGGQQHAPRPPVIFIRDQGNKSVPDERLQRVAERREVHDHGFGKCLLCRVAEGGDLRQERELRPLQTYRPSRRHTTDRVDGQRGERRCSCSEARRLLLSAPTCVLPSVISVIIGYDSHRKLKKFRSTLEEGHHRNLYSGIYQ